jgi:signal peptidase I
MQTKWIILLVLVALFLALGGIWLVDLLFFRSRRRRLAKEQPERAGRPFRQPLIVALAGRCFFAVAIALVLYALRFETFRIPSGAMMPTLMVGDFVVVDKAAFGYHLSFLDSIVGKQEVPARGDVVVFSRPDEPDVKYIKRVVGVPGDLIAYRNKMLVVNGKEIAQTDAGQFVGVGSDARRMAGANVKKEMLTEEGYQILQAPALMPGREGEWLVPEDQYFILGDNRDNSEDSRYWGFVPVDNLVGKALFVWMNWSEDTNFKRAGSRIR